MGQVYDRGLALRCEVLGIPDGLDAFKAANEALKEMGNVAQQAALARMPSHATLRAPACPWSIH